MTRVAPLLVGVLGVLVGASASSAQSISASPNPFTPGATITVTAQSPTPPPPGTNVCGLDPCYVLSTYATVYIQGSNGFTGFNDAYDGPAAYLGYDTQPGQAMTAADYELYTEVWVEVCLSWGGGGECLSSDYWLHDDGWDVASVTPMGVPAPVSVTPGSGGGPTQTFQLQYAASSGAAHIAEGWLWIDATGAAGHTSCVVQYKTADHTLYLLNDAGTAWTSGAIDVGPLLQNSQCAVNPVAAGASPSGNTWTVNVPITFAAGYAGAKSVWLYAAGPAGSSGWQLLGTWTARARVDSAWPGPGVVGGTLTVQGLGFGSSQGTSTVTVNGVSASVSSWSDTTIAATVPAGATTGPVVVTTAGQASNGLSYTIVDGPQLSHLAPSWGPVATTVTLHGTNFGSTAGAVLWHEDRDASSGWQPVAHGSWSDTSITLTIPSGLVTGFFKVERAGVLSNGSPFTVGTEEVQYHHTDGIGSLRLVTGVQGHVVSRHEYQPFGEEWLAAGAHDADRLGFGGKELDEETGSGGWMALNYFGARYLHSATGRFTSVDPVLPADLALLNPQRWNRYTYVMNRPLVVTDPDGRCPLCPTMQRLGQVASNFASRYGTPLYNWATRFFNSSAGQDAVELAADAFGLSGNIGRLSTWEKQTGEVLEVAEHVGSEFVTAAGKTIDAMGVPHAYGRFWNWNQFSLSIRKHLSKSNDHTVIDLTGASPEQIAQIQEYVESLGKDAVEHFLYVRD